MKGIHFRDFPDFPKKKLSKRDVKKIVKYLGAPSDFCFNRIDDGCGVAVDIHRMVEYARLVKKLLK
jgi:hypothetical protein